MLSSASVSSKGLPAATRPSPPATGPRRTLMPLSLASWPIACPRRYISPLSNVAPVVMPAGKTETQSAKRTPVGESCRQRLRRPRRGTAPTLPTQRSLAQLQTPVPKSVNIRYGLFGGRGLPVAIQGVMMKKGGFVDLPYTGCQVDLLKQGHLRDKVLCFDIGLLPPVCIWVHPRLRVVGF